MSEVEGLLTMEIIKPPSYSSIGRIIQTCWPKLNQQQATVIASTTHLYRNPYNVLLYGATNGLIVFAIESINMLQCLVFSSAVGQIAEDCCSLVATGKLQCVLV